jgi:multiple sugar transport system substrate-binding protein
MQVFLQQMQDAAARGPLPNWSDVSAVIQDAIQAALSGQATPDQAMQDAASQLAGLLPSSAP